MAENKSGVLSALKNSSDEGLKTLFSVLNALPELAFLLSSDGEYLDIFGGDESLLVQSSNELLGKSVYDVMPMEKADLIVNTIGRALSEKRNVTVEYELEVPKGICMFEAGVAPIENLQIEKQVVIWFARDITSQRKEEEKLRYLAFNDVLTDLPNRRLLEQRMEEENARCLRHDQISAVLFIDIDDFKSINDKFGHQVGDSVLVNIAQQLKKMTRLDDFACRLAGDEFVVILSMVGNDVESARHNAFASAENLLCLLNEPIPIDAELSNGEAEELKISASIGISLLPSLHLKSKFIINEADRAMYSAKLSGKSKISFLDSGH